MTSDFQESTRNAREQNRPSAKSGGTVLRLVEERLGLCFRGALLGAGGTTCGKTSRACLSERQTRHPGRLLRLQASNAASEEQQRHQNVSMILSFAVWTQAAIALLLASTPPWLIECCSNACCGRLSTNGRSSSGKARWQIRFARFISRLVSAQYPSDKQIPRIQTERFCRPDR